MGTFYAKFSRAEFGRVEPSSAALLSWAKARAFALFGAAAAQARSATDTGAASAAPVTSATTARSENAFFWCNRFRIEYPEIL